MPTAPAAAASAAARSTQQAIANERGRKFEAAREERRQARASARKAA